LKIPSVLFLCLFSLVTTSSLAAGPQYSSRKDIATAAQGLAGITVADFNGDGKPDIAVLDTHYVNVFVYLNQGNGNFSAPVATNVSLLGTGRTLVAGDFNGDGKQDLIASFLPFASASSSIFLAGNGDGTFTAQQQISTGNNGFDVMVAADINRDSHLDFVGEDTQGLTVVLGDGNGSFQYQTFAPFSSISLGLFAADVNADSNPDLIFAGAGGAPGLNLYTGHGDGTFAGPTPITTDTTTGSQRKTIATADFNGDGKLDLLVGMSPGVEVIFGNGDGTFQSATSAIHVLHLPPQKASSYASAAVADVNGDGKPDIVVADASSDTMDVYLNDGTGTFSQSAPDFTADILSSSTQILTADFDGDGLPDIAIASASNNTVSLFFSVQPKADFQISTPTPAQTIAAGASASYSIVVTPVGGFTGSVTVTCSQLPAFASCDPVMVPVNGQPATATVTVHTTAQHSAVKTAEIGFAALFLLTLLPLRRRISFRLMAAVAIFALIGFGSGCSGGGSSSKSGGSVTGTPPGSTSFTITGTVTQGGQTVSHSTTATIVVQ